MPDENLAPPTEHSKPKSPQAPVRNVVVAAKKTHKKAPQGIVELEDEPPPQPKKSGNIISALLNGDDCEYRAKGIDVISTERL